MSKSLKLTEDIGHELKAIQKRNGLIMPEAVVEAASGTTNILHSYFEWEDSEAARKYRIHQARLLLSSFTIYNEEMEVQVRALTSIDLDRDNGGGYRWTMEAMKRPDLREQVVQTALKELMALENKYNHLKELADVWDAIKIKAGLER